MNTISMGTKNGYMKIIYVVATIKNTITNVFMAVSHLELCVDLIRKLNIRNVADKHMYNAAPYIMLIEKRSATIIQKKQK